MTSPKHSAIDSDRIMTSSKHSTIDSNMIMTSPKHSAIDSNRIMTSPKHSTIDSNIHPLVNKHTVIRYRNLTNFDEELFLRDLKNQNFNLVLQITDPDLSLDSWYDKFIYTLNKHALSPNGTKKNLPTYVSKGIIIMV